MMRPWKVGFWFLLFVLLLFPRLVFCWFRFSALMLLQLFSTCTSARWSCYAAASFTQTPQNQTVSVGGSFNLTCGVGGNPLPEIRWEIPDDVDATIGMRITG